MTRVTNLFKDIERLHAFEQEVETTSNVTGLTPEEVNDYLQSYTHSELRTGTWI